MGEVNFSNTIGSKHTTNSESKEDFEKDSISTDSKMEGPENRENQGIKLTEGGGLARITHITELFQNTLGSNVSNTPKTGGGYRLS